MKLCTFLLQNSTIICNLDNHHPVALLSDRLPQTLTEWLKAEIIFSCTSDEQGWVYRISSGDYECQPFHPSCI